MTEYKGRIDVDLAEQFLADTTTAFTAKSPPTSALSAATSTW